MAMETVYTSWWLSVIGRHNRCLLHIYTAVSTRAHSLRSVHSVHWAEVAVSSDLCWSHVASWLPSKAPAQHNLKVSRRNRCLNKRQRQNCIWRKMTCVGAQKRNMRGEKLPPYGAVCICLMWLSQIRLHSLTIICPRCCQREPHIFHLLQRRCL